MTAFLSHLFSTVHFETLFKFLAMAGIFLVILAISAFLQSQIVIALGYTFATITTETTTQIAILAISTFEAFWIYSLFRHGLG